MVCQGCKYGFQFVKLHLIEPRIVKLSLIEISLLQCGLCWNNFF